MPSALKRELKTIWEQLRSQNRSRANAITEMRLRNMRGIKDVRVPFPFPVAVVAGLNGCGKSTILFALASAYRMPDQDKAKNNPGTLFPRFKPPIDKFPDIQDKIDPNAAIEFLYIAKRQSFQMRWSYGKRGWSRSYFGRKNMEQPIRPWYLRTIANLSNPSEVRSVLQLAKKSLHKNAVDSNDIALAQRILGFRYDIVHLLSDGNKDLLFVERKTASDNLSAQANYSEFNMSAGERAIIRLSMTISQMEDALVLIDELETGLHPQAQQLLMLELQRLALRQSLQIIVTTHSSVVLDTVPIEARIFLERNDENVVILEPYRDLIQKALYGQSMNALSILCEDEEAESFIRGILDYLVPKINLLQDDIVVGRNTGKDEFVSHVKSFGSLKKLKDIVFVLDGDAREIGPKLESTASGIGQTAKVLFLPGNNAPEEWVWKILKEYPKDYANFFALSSEHFLGKMNQQERLYEAATDKPSAIAKNRLSSLVESASRAMPELMRLVGRTEAEKNRGEMKEWVYGLEKIIQDWRAEER